MSRLAPISARSERLGASQAAKSKVSGIRACKECGGPIASPDRRKQYCHSNCRKRFNRRRERRGAILYDLYMPHRFERPEATEARILTQINRICMYWREADVMHRGGRPSWGDWKKVLEDRPYLRAIRGWV